MKIDVNTLLVRTRMGNSRNTAGSFYTVEEMRSKRCLVAIDFQKYYTDTEFSGDGLLFW